MVWPESRRQLVLHFQALGNVTRMRLLERLAEAGEQPVGELARYLRMSQPRVSWHLSLLRRGGAVKQRKEGRVVLCAIDMDSIRRQQLAFWELLNENKRIGVRT